jgi:hypothetical protein
LRARSGKPCGRAAAGYGEWMTDRLLFGLAFVAIGLVVIFNREADARHTVEIRESVVPPQARCERGKDQPPGLPPGRRRLNHLGSWLRHQRPLKRRSVCVKACGRAAAGYAETVKLVRSEAAPHLLAAVVYLAAFGSVVYIGDFPFSEGLFFLAPLLFGAFLRTWWAFCVPLLVLIPLPIFLTISPPDASSEYDALGVGFLVAFWTVIQVALVALGIGLRHLGAMLFSQRQPRLP